MKGTFALALLALAACHSAATTKQQDKAHVSAPAQLPLIGRVNDFAHILSERQAAHLTDQSEMLERTTQHQLVVVTVNSLNGQDIADFTRQLGNDWGIGRAKQNDGVVLLVAPNEHKVRIGTGYGLEKTLTDTLCSQIIQTKMLPRFRDGDLPGGIDAGVDAIVEALERNGRYLP